MKRMYRLGRAGQLAALLSIALIGIISTSSPAIATPSTQAGSETSSPPDPPAGSAAQQAHVWTKEEMLAAQPYPIKEAVLTPSAQAQQVLLPSGAPGSVEGQAPENRSTRNTTDAPLSTTVSNEGPSPLGYTYPFPFTRYEVFTSYSASPYMKIGKLFFKQYGVSYQCSAASQGNSGVITAGHCIHAGNGDIANGWSTNVVFVPAYKDGNAPYGQWSCNYSTERAFNAWIYNASFNRDVAGCKTNLRSGLRLSQKVGSLGFAWNYSSDQDWHAFGYPGELPFNGKRLIVCTASRATWDMTSVSPATQGIGCDMNRGSSGGPWLLGFNSGGGYVNGVNSYKYFTDQPNASYSPYFDDAVKTGIYDYIVAP